MNYYTSSDDPLGNHTQLCLILALGSKRSGVGASLLPSGKYPNYERKYPNYERKSSMVCAEVLKKTRFFCFVCEISQENATPFLHILHQCNLKSGVSPNTVVFIVAFYIMFTPWVSLHIKSSDPSSIRVYPDTSPQSSKHEQGVPSRSQRRPVTRGVLPRHREHVSTASTETQKRHGFTLVLCNVVHNMSDMVCFVPHFSYVCVVLCFWFFFSGSGRKVDLQSFVFHAVQGWCMFSSMTMFAVSDSPAVANLQAEQQGVRDFRCKVIV